MAALARIRVVLVVAVLVLVGVGCTRDLGPVADRDHPVAGKHLVAVDESALVGPGGELAPGVRVQAGSALVAQVFPASDFMNGSGDAIDGAWQAMVVVDGDPVDVWDRYTKALGVAETASARTSCLVSRLVTLKPASGHRAVVRREGRYLTDPAQDHEDRIDCRASTGEVSLALSVGTFTCFADQTPPCRNAPVANLYIRVGPHNPYSGGVPGIVVPPVRGRPSGTAPAAGPIHRPHLHPTGRSTLPGAGQPVDADMDDYLSYQAAGAKVQHPAIDILPAGTRSLVAPAMLLGCNSGLVAVVHDRRSPRAATARFEGPNESTTPFVNGHGRFRGRSWSSIDADTAGGYELPITAVASPQGGSDLLITECGD